MRGSRTLPDCRRGGRLTAMAAQRFRIVRVVSVKIWISTNGVEIRSAASKSPPEVHSKRGPAEPALSLSNGAAEHQNCPNWIFQLANEAITDLRGAGRLSTKGTASVVALRPTVRAEAALDEGHGFSRAVKGLERRLSAAEVRFSRHIGRERLLAGLVPVCPDGFFFGWELLAVQERRLLGCAHRFRRMHAQANMRGPSNSSA
jgi:hypothetical protein